MADIEFEWDERKAAGNLEKHLISFDDAIRIFEKPVLLVRSDRNVEQRYKALGIMEGHCIAVVYTMRDTRYRIISARRARRNEERAYREAYPTQ